MVYSQGELARNKWRYMDNQRRAIQEHIAGLWEQAAILKMLHSDAEAMSQLQETLDDIQDWQNDLAALHVEMARQQQQIRPRVARSAQQTQQKAG